jgi:hypothetical protein
MIQLYDGLKIEGQDFVWILVKDFFNPSTLIPVTKVNINPFNTEKY